MTAPMENVGSFGALLSGLAVFIGCVLYVAIKATSTFRKLEGHAGTVKDRVQAGYRELYDLEKERNESLSRKIVTLEQDMERMRKQLVAITTQNQELIRLNIRLQTKLEGALKDNLEKAAKMAVAQAVVDVDPSGGPDIYTVQQD